MAVTCYLLPVTCYLLPVTCYLLPDAFDPYLHPCVASALSQPLLRRLFRPIAQTDPATELDDPLTVATSLDSRNGRPIPAPNAMTR